MTGTPGELRVEVWPMRTGSLYFPVTGQRDPDQEADAVLAALEPGSPAYVTDARVRDELLARDAREVRHLFTMRHQLHELGAPPDVPGVSFRPWEDGDAPHLAEAFLGAYGAGHPDQREPDTEKAGEYLLHTAEDPDNPCMSGTLVAVHEGAPVAAALVLRSDHVPGWCGPWLMNTFRSPRAPKGLGAAMLTRSLHEVRDAGGPHMGLAVTAANPARRVYQRLGFVDDSEGWVLVTPEPAGS